MDELIRQIIKDLGIDNKFLKNYRTYEILKENIRNKLKDIYADEILNNYTSEKMLNQVQEEDLISSYRKEKLLICLDHQNPFLSFCEMDEPISTITGGLSDILRKELKEAIVLDVNLINEDRVVDIA